jgi:hypothetical protein
MKASCRLPQAMKMFRIFVIVPFTGFVVRNGELTRFLEFEKSSANKGQLAIHGHEND